MYPIAWWNGPCITSLSILHTNIATTLCFTTLTSVMLLNLRGTLRTCWTIDDTTRAGSDRVEFKVSPLTMANILIIFFLLGLVNLQQQSLHTRQCFSESFQQGALVLSLFKIELQIIQVHPHRNRRAHLHNYVLHMLQKITKLTFPLSSSDTGMVYAAVAAAARSRSPSLCA